MSSSSGESTADATPQPVADLGVRLGADITALEAELTEIDMLVNQAQTEATRHEQRRAQTAEKLASGVNLPPDDIATLNSQLLSLTRRAAVMESQVEVLEGKRKSLARYRDTLVDLASRYGGI